MSEIHKTAKSKEEDVNSMENQTKKETNGGEESVNKVSYIEKETKDAGKPEVVNTPESEKSEIEDKNISNVQNIKSNIASNNETNTNDSEATDTPPKTEKNEEKDSKVTCKKDKDDKEKKNDVLDKDEEICFESRARLYRYNTEKSSWKERGTGKVQLMKHKETGRIRILMRRDQTFVICCNHFITPEMYLKPLETSANTFTWYTAGDHYDGEINSEVLAIKLPGAVAKKFETIFNYAIKDDQEALTKIVLERSQA